MGGKVKGRIGFHNFIRLNLKQSGVRREKSKKMQHADSNQLKTLPCLQEVRFGIRNITLLHRAKNKHLTVFDQAIVQVRSRRLSSFFHLRSLLAPDVKGILIIRQDGNAILGSESFVRIIHLAFPIIVVQQHVHMTPLIRRSPSRVDTFAPIGVQIFHVFLWVWCVHGGKDLC